MSRPFLRHDRHPMFEEHRDHDGWKIMLFGLVGGAVSGLAIVYAIAGGA
jgi:hypothetical protein